MILVGHCIQSNAPLPSTRWPTRGTPVRMKFPVLVAVAFSFVLISGASTQPTADLPTVFIVRHADRASVPVDDPGLTVAGQRRAEDLAATLGNAGITAIVTTHLRRSRETAAPLTSKLKIDAQTFPLPSKGEKLEREQHIKEIVDAIRKQKNGAVLVVGHETTMPLIIAALGGPKIAEICSSVYDALFILAPSKEGVGFVSTRYGAVTECR